MSTSSFRFAVLSVAFASLPSLAAAQAVLTHPEVTPSVHHDHLPSLRGVMARPEDMAGPGRVREWKRTPHIDGPGWVDDRAAQSQLGTSAAAVTPGLGFDGLGAGFPGFTVKYAPPDTTGAVGATQYVQWVNDAFAVFDKSTGALVAGPAAGNSLWSGFGGPCEVNNDGDPIVQYDKLAGRWVMSQFAVPGGSAGYYQCVAVSQTSDATGAWNRYSFQYTQFPDYPKVGVWPDAYYVTFNMFTNTFQGARVCAYDRAAMLAGGNATQQCFQLSTSYASLLPADLDGTNSPPAGTPNYLVNRLPTSLGFWKFKVDFANPSNTRLTGPTQIPVAAYNAACSGGTCIPQPGTRQKLDSLADRLMYRLAYRNLAGTETLVVNHSVDAGTRKSPRIGVRWYEIRNPAGTPTLFQQSSFVPADGVARWMGSIAMDKQGNVALGYSVSNAVGVHPGLRYATRLAGDPLNQLGSETTIVDGGGSQTQSLSRWGDYTHMSVDPVDGCTFWYTGQYLKADGTFNWSTRIASFRIAGCQ